MSSVAMGMPSGTPDVFAKLYGEFHPRVLKLCQHLLGSREEAEDAANEVFVRLPRALRTYDREQPFWGWLSTVARHHCVDRLRSRRSEQRVIQPVEPEAPVPVSQTVSPLDELLRSEAREAVRAAIARLPERYRSPLILRYYRYLTYAEIGLRLGLSRANVAILVFRAKQRLRVELSKKGRGNREAPSGMLAACIRPLFDVRQPAANPEKTVEDFALTRVGFKVTTHDHEPRAHLATPHNHSSPGTRIRVVRAVDGRERALDHPAPPDRPVPRRPSSPWARAVCGPRSRSARGVYPDPSLRLRRVCLHRLHRRRGECQGKGYWDATAHLCREAGGGQTVHLPLRLLF